MFALHAVPDTGSTALVMLGFQLTNSSGALMQICDKAVDETVKVKGSYSTGRAEEM